MARSRYLILRLVGVVALLSLLVVSMASTGAQSEDSAGIRIIHAGIDTPPVDVSVDGESVAEGLFWLEATDYTDVPSGDHEIEIFDPDTSLDEALAAATVTTDAGTNYSAVITGELPEPAIVLLVDGDEEGTEAGMGAVRFFHGVPDTGAIDVVTGDGTVLAQGLEVATASDYVMVAPGAHDIEFLEAGTENILYTEVGVTIEEGEFQTSYLTGFAALDNFAAETFIDEAGEADGNGDGEPTAEPTDAADATATQEPEPTGEPGGTATEAPEATTTPEPEPTATSTPAPDMPSTGAGGMATGSGETGLAAFASLALLCLAGGGGLLYWSRRAA